MEGNCTRPSINMTTSWKWKLNVFYFVLWLVKVLNWLLIQNKQGKPLGSSLLLHENSQTYSIVQCNPCKLQQIEGRLSYKVMNVFINMPFISCSSLCLISARAFGAYRYTSEGGKDCQHPGYCHWRWSQHSPAAATNCDNTGKSGRT